MTDSCLICMFHTLLTILKQYSINYIIIYYEILQNLGDSQVSSNNIIHHKILSNNFLQFLSRSPSTPLHRVKNNAIYSPHQSFSGLLFMCPNHFNRFSILTYLFLLLRVQFFSLVPSKSNIHSHRIQLLSLIHI